MLLGQNVNSYGKTLEEPMSFAQLLREVEKVEGLERIRFMTPSDTTCFTSLMISSGLRLLSLPLTYGTIQ